MHLAGAYVTLAMQTRLDFMSFFPRIRRPADRFRAHPRQRTKTDTPVFLAPEEAKKSFEWPNVFFWAIGTFRKLLDCFSGLLHFAAGHAAGAELRRAGEPPAAHQSGAERAKVAPKQRQIVSSPVFVSICAGEKRAQGRGITCLRAFLAAASGAQQVTIWPVVDKRHCGQVLLEERVNRKRQAERKL